MLVVILRMITEIVLLEYILYLRGTARGRKGSALYNTTMLYVL